MNEKIERRLREFGANDVTAYSHYADLLRDKFYHSRAARHHTSADRRDNMHAAREKTDTKIKAILSDSQKQTYEQMQQRMRERMQQRQQQNQKQNSSPQ